MPFLSNIPRPTDQLSISQGDILNNFGILGAIAGNAAVNSDSLNPTVGFNFVNLALPGAAATTGANQMALYTGANANSNRQELYVVHQNTTVPVAMTAYRTNGTATTGWTRLPSGVLMAWGTATIVAGGTINVLYSSLTGFPGFVTMGTPTVSRLRNAVPPANAFVYVSTYNSAQFTVYSSTGNNNVPFTWMSIGI